MNPDIGEQIVRWTARLAVAAYIVRLWTDINGWPGDSERSRNRERWVRGTWTFGCGIYLLHVAAAFHFVHHWSHSVAAAHTASQTADLTDWRWSGGLWINYAFTLWWPLDVVWSWRRGLNRLPRSYVISLHLAVGFLIFNATVVFGPSWWWGIFLVVIASLIVSAIRQSRNVSRR